MYTQVGGDFLRLVLLGLRNGASTLLLFDSLPLWVVPETHSIDHFGHRFWYSRPFQRRDLDIIIYSKLVCYFPSPTFTQWWRLKLTISQITLCADEHHSAPRDMMLKLGQPVRLDSF